MVCHLCVYSLVVKEHKAPLLLSLKESVWLPVGHPIPSRYGQIRIITPPFKPNDHSVGLPAKINSTSDQRREYPHCVTPSACTHAPKYTLKLSYTHHTKRHIQAPTRAYRVAHACTRSEYGTALFGLSTGSLFSLDHKPVSRQQRRRRFPYITL